MGVTHAHSHSPYMHTQHLHSKDKLLECLFLRRIGGRRPVVLCMYVCVELKITAAVTEATLTGWQSDHYDDDDDDDNVDGGDTDNNTTMLEISSTLRLDSSVSFSSLSPRPSTL